MAGSVILLIFLFLFLAIITLLLLDYYGDRKTFAWHTQVICFVSFYIAFAIIAMLPLDLSSTKYRYCMKNSPSCEPPILDLDEDSLYVFWKTVYWISFNIQMFSNPIMAGYWRSGGFTVKRRLNDGIMENVIFYAQVGIPSVFFIIYAIFGLQIPANKLLDLAIPAMNAYGLILLVLLLSYGLVEIPRDLWFSSNVEWVLRYFEATVPSLKEQCVDSEAEVYEVARILALASTKISANDPLRSKLDTIMEKCPLALNERQAVLEEANALIFNEEYLVALNARINRAHTIHRQQSSKLKMLQTEAFFFQDVLASASNPEMLFESRFWSIKVPEGPYKKPILQMAWWWFVKIRPLFMKISSIFCIVLTALVIWSESTFQFSSARLSIPALILNPSNSSYFMIEILSMCFVCYMCACIFSSLFRLKLFEFCQMMPNHHSDEASMLFVGAYLCKLSFPIVYNFLNMAGQATGSIEDSPVFIQYFGPAVNMTPLLGEGYNDWVPFLIIIVSAIFLSNLHGRIAKFYGMTNTFYETNMGRGDAEGRQILETARVLEVRRLQREGTNQTPSSLGSSSVPRARNTIDLLEKYKKGESNSSSSGKVGKSTDSLSRMGRAFGNLNFKNKNNGYKSIDDDYL